MVTMLSSYWHSVTVLALVVIISINFSVVASYCSDRNNFCVADNRLDHLERQISVKERQFGNEYDRSFRDGLRRQVVATDRIRQTESERGDRLELERLSRNTRLDHSHRDRKTIGSDERRNRVSRERSGDRQLNFRSQRIGATGRRLESNIVRDEIRNNFGIDSVNVLRTDRVREARDVRNLDRKVDEGLIRIGRDREERGRREQVLEERVRREILNRGNRVREERDRVEKSVDQRIRDQRVLEKRHRLEQSFERLSNEERIRNEPQRMNRVMDQKRREDRVRMRTGSRVEVRLTRVREQRIREERTRQQAIAESRIRDLQKRVDNVHTRLITDSNVRRNDRREIRRIDRARTDELTTRENRNTRRERVSEQRDSSFREENLQRNDRRDTLLNRRVRETSERRDAQGYREQHGRTNVREISSSEERREQRQRLSHIGNIHEKFGARRTIFRSKSVPRREADITSVERENRFSDRLSVLKDGEVPVYHFSHIQPYSQLTWSLCQALLIGAIVLQLLKSKGEKSKSLFACINDLPGISPIKAS